MWMVYIVIGGDRGSFDVLAIKDAIDESCARESEVI